jgi:hypothetical protein
MEVGNIVEAQFNGAWYPCVIQSKVGDEVSVEFLGYKNKESLPQSNCRLISLQPSLKGNDIVNGKL